MYNTPFSVSDVPMYAYAVVVPAVIFMIVMIVKIVCVMCEIRRISSMINKIENSYSPCRNCTDQRCMMCEKV